MTNFLSSWPFIIGAGVVLVALCFLLFYLRKNQEED
jgi:LPXTG-motif cell wall-anchored protein